MEELEAESETDRLHFLLKMKQEEASSYSTAADVRWSLLEKLANGWHAVIIPVINPETAHDIIEWVQKNMKSGTRLHMEGPQIESGNKGVGVFEDKAEAALFKTMWAFND